jgi:probable DNA repair protein
VAAHLHPEVLRRLDTGNLLVLPTARAASELRRLFDARQREANRPSWELANVQSWSQWTQSLWTNLVVNGAEMRLLLNTAQEQSLWEELISLDQTRNGLGSPTALAALARSGFQRAASWNATGRLRASATTEDSRIFGEWSDAFLALCKKRSYLSSSLLESALIRAVDNGSLAPQSTVAFAACNNLTPAQHSLLDALGAAGTDILHLPPAAETEDTDRTAVTLPTEQDELLYAARWIRTRLEAATQQGLSTKIALLVPDLDTTHTQIERILRDTLAPELHNIAADLSSTPWDLAIRAPLTTISVITDALDLVRWAAGPLPIERVTALLLSPHLGFATDRDAAARFDAQTLRRTTLLRPELDLAGTLRLRSNIDPPLWLQNLHTEVQRASDLTRPRSYADWTELFRNLTRAANWPGDRELSATELAIVEAWESALDTVATLDFSGQRVAISDALTAITQQLEAASLQPPSSNAPVQVLTPAEADACLFDAILYLRATDANLPTHPSAHPLLSWQLQHSLQMPGTDPALDTARARHDLNALLANTTTALFTHAQQNDDGKLRPSPFLSGLNATATNIPITPVTPIPLEPWPDTTPLPTPPTHITGGSRVLQLQAACGFRAFAEIRLRATEPDTRGLALGLDASEAGNIIHRAMDLFWRTVRTQHALLHMPTPEREATLRSAIADALSRNLHPVGPWETAYIEMQHSRIFNLLSQWLDKELERGPFTVLERELTQQIPIGPLTLDVRFDRIDAVQSDDASGFVLVDYKSGRGGHPSAWQDDRPLDPQLPLYALLYEPAELKGLAFANLRLGKDMKWLGYQAEDGILPKSRTNTTVDFEQQLSAWHTTLTMLAEDFFHGRTGVDPAHYPHTCEHCAQRLLCRLDPSSLLDADDATAEEQDV